MHPIDCVKPTLAIAVGETISLMWWPSVFPILIETRGVVTPADLVQQCRLFEVRCRVVVVIVWLQPQANGVSPDATDMERDGGVQRTGAAVVSSQPDGQIDVPSCNIAIEFSM